MKADVVLCSALLFLCARTKSSYLLVQDSAIDSVSYAFVEVTRGRASQGLGNDLYQGRCL
ncbi:hypothetical protein WAI453_011036 [Rhynchosporium graminicola]